MTKTDKQRAGMAFTDLYDNVSKEKVGETYPGMAHWAGGGPDFKTCRECLLWQRGSRYGTGEPKGQKHELRPGICAKYAKETGIKNKKIPHRAKACKYFQENLNAPIAIGIDQ